MLSTFVENEFNLYLLLSMRSARCYQKLIPTHVWNHLRILFLSDTFTFSLGHLSFKSRVIQRHVMNLRRIRRWRLYDTRVDCKPRKFDIFKIEKPRYIACCSVRTADNALNMVQTKSYQVEFIRVQEEVERHAFVVQFPSGS